MRRLVYAVVAAAVAIAALPAHAQDAGKFPERPIRLVVGFPPGGATDILARILAQHIPEQMGQPLVVDNRPGAGGTIGAAIVAKSPPDGYTLLMVPSGPYTVGANIYLNVPYHPVNDFTGVSLLVWVTNVIVVPQASPIKSLQELIQMAKQKPVTFSSSGSGSLHHLSGEVLKRMTRTDMTHVPFKGAGPALQALAGNEVTFGFTSMPSAAPLINAKRVRAIAVTGEKRLAALPQTPTMTEAGAPPPAGLDIREWYGPIAPAKTPAAIINKLNAEMVKVFKRPDVQTRLVDMGAEFVGSSPQAVTTQLGNDVRQWAKWVKEVGVKVD